MKKIISQYGLLAGIIALFALVFTFGGMYSRFMTAQIEVRAHTGTGTEYIDMMDGATGSVAFTSAAVAKTYALAGGRGDFTPTLDASYKLYNGTQEIGVVYVITSNGKLPGLQVAFAIDLATDQVVAVKVLAQSETPSYYAALGAAFFAQFDAMALDDIGLAVDAVAGSTYSSKGFEIALLYAREHYAVDYGFTIPAIVMTLNSVTYNFDPDTFVAMPFIADVTYGDADTNVVVYLDVAFDYAGLVSGTEPAADVKAAIKSNVAASGDVSANVGFESYDPDSRELVIFSKGFNAAPIRVTVILNGTLDGVASFEVDSNETYAEDEAREDSGYAGGEVPAVEDAFMNDYQIDGVLTLDAVAGATYTSPAMRALIALLDQFINSVGGGD